MRRSSLLSIVGYGVPPVFIYKIPLVLREEFIITLFFLTCHQRYHFNLTKLDGQGLKTGVQYHDV